MKFDNEFKLALSHLPSQEKDKLLFRLLKKDLVLANRLYFELVDTDNVDERREELKQNLITKIKGMSDYYYSPGLLMMDMRTISGIINDHVKTTKDKFGEVSLSILLLNEFLRLNNSKLKKTAPHKIYKFSIYVVAKVFKILMWIQSFHEDIQIEFEEPLSKLQGHIINNSYLMNASTKNGLDMNWLLSGNIPANIKEIHKDLRANGFLK